MAKVVAAALPGSLPPRLDSCPLCGHGRIGAVDATLHRCPDCGIEIAAHAPAAPPSPTGDPALVLSEIVRHARAGCLLDANAGRGDFLTAADAAGFDPFGIAWSTVEAELCRREFGSDRIRCPEAPAFDADTFDVAVVTGLLECLSDPLGLFEQLRGWLKPDGLVCVLAPGGKPPAANRAAITHWSARALRRAAVLTGYRVMSLRTVTQAGPGLLGRLIFAAARPSPHQILAVLRRDDPV
ncbi:MAG: methyltransferase domain-containing protein [Acidobacteria bacterium]|nr:methyltransferase domain-containing protein [Acidobacteriota bacterium]